MTENGIFTGLGMTVLVNSENGFFVHTS